MKVWKLCLIKVNKFNYFNQLKNFTLSISISILPLGIGMLRVSQADLPIRARAIGEEMDILFFCKSDSSAPTI